MKIKIGNGEFVDYSYHNPSADPAAIIFSDEEMRIIKEREVISGKSNLLLAIPSLSVDGVDEWIADTHKETKIVDEKFNVTLTCTKDEE